MGSSRRGGNGSREQAGTDHKGVVGPQGIRLRFHMVIDKVNTNAPSAQIKASQRLRNGFYPYVARRQIDNAEAVVDAEVQFVLRVEVRGGVEIRTLDYRLNLPPWKVVMTASRSCDLFLVFL